MRKLTKSSCFIILLISCLSTYSQTHVIDNAGTITWYKIGSLSGNGASVSVRVTSTSGYGSAGVAKGETWGKVAIGNADDDFGGWYTEIGGYSTRKNSLGWVKTGIMKIDVYLKAETYNRGTIHVFDGFGFTSNFSSTTSDPLITDVSNQFNLVSGDVGIGTSSPRERLDVTGSILVEDVVTSNATDRNAGFYTYRDKAYGMELHYQQSKWGLAVFARNGSDIRLGHYVANETQQDNLNAKMVVKPDGYIGIGTDTPSARLNVVGDAFKWENSANDNNAKVIIEDGSGLANPAIKLYRWLGGTSTNFYPGHIELAQTGGVSRMDFRMGPTASIGSEAMTTALSIENTGNVGIGTTSPGSKLQIAGSSGNWNEITQGLSKGTIHLDPENSTNHYGNALTFGASDDSGLGENAQAGIYVRTDGTYGSKLYFSTTDSYAEGSKTRMMITHTGNVGIGTTNPDEKLTVAGNIHAQEVKVTIGAGTGPDYVFEPDYNLKSLEEIEKFIKSNNHLPEIPSAKEMEANGVQLGEMNMLLLKKIEELTLYTLEQERRIQELEIKDEKLNSPRPSDTPLFSKRGEEVEDLRGELEKKITELKFLTITQSKQIQNLKSQNDQLSQQLMVNSQAQQELLKRLNTLEEKINEDEQ